MKIKKLIFLILIGAAAVTLAACGNSPSNAHTASEYENRHNFPPADMSEYEIAGDHFFYDVTMYDALQLLDDESFNGIIYFGFSACPWCQAAIPAIHEASQETNTDIFYVSRRHDLREGQWLEWDEEMAWFLDEQIEMRWLYYNEDGEVTTEVSDEPARPNIFVPQIIHLRDGIIVAEHGGTFEGHDQEEDGLPELSDDEYMILLENYIRIFSNVHTCGIDGDNGECL